MRVLTCAGGTGGGVYPALSVLEQLQSEFATSNLELLWVGGEGGMEETLVKRMGIPYQSIPAAGVHGVGLRALPRNIGKLARGYFASRKILREFRPDALFFTGGYIAAPMALAGMSVPALLYVPDIEPALALKTIARFADRIAVTAAESRNYFPARARVVETGYPVRKELTKWERAEARAAFNLHDEKPVLLVTGGSRGARSINQAVLHHLPSLLEMAQVIHISGELDWPVVEAAARQTSGMNRRDYHAYPYLHEEMGAALRAADLVLSRAGASSVGEYPLLGLPAILVPYPHAWRYQKVNADYLVQRGAAVLLEDEKLKEKLLETVQKLLRDPNQLAQMRANASSMARPQAARFIAEQLAEMAKEAKS